MTTTLEAQTTPQILELHTTGAWQGQFRTDVAVRGFGFTVAEPVVLGGDNSAPNPLEYVLGGFEGCIAVVVEVVTRERGITLHDVRLNISGSIDLRGFGGVPGVSPSFRTIDGAVHVFADIDEPTFRDLIDETERRCPLFNLFRDAGVTPDIRWSLNI